MMLKSKTTIMSIVQKFMIGIVVVSGLYFYTVAISFNPTVYNFTVNNLWSIPLVIIILFLVGYYINVDKECHKYDLLEGDLNFDCEYPDW